MSRLKLALALNPVDHVNDLMTGAVQADGMEFIPLALPVEEIFYRFSHYQEWDVSEMSLAKFVALRAGGDAPMVGLPVFTSRVFRHSSIYVRSDSDITEAKQLEGRSIGVPEWAQTAGVWVRGMLSEFYDVDLASIRWMQAGVNQPGRHEKISLNLPAGVSCTPRPDRSLSDLLDAGEIDAVISARPPSVFAAGRARRLFPEFRADESAYHKRTGIFPIMHVATVKRATYEEHPWVAQSLVKAFDQARSRSLERMLDITASPAPLAWMSALATEIAEQFDGDPWPYGVEPNRPTLEAFCRYAHEQGVAARHMKPEDLFARETLSSFRV